MLIEFPTGVLRVASASDPTVEPGFLHRRVLSEIETADGAVGVLAWKHKVRVTNSHFHGPKALRRRLYTFALSPEVVEAAERAGIEFPAPPVPVPFSERRILADALVPSEIIDEHHAHLYLDETLTPRRLLGDGADRAQAARIWTGQREPEPVSDVRLPSHPSRSASGRGLTAHGRRERYWRRRRRLGVLKKRRCVRCAMDFCSIPLINSDGTSPIWLRATQG